jgi:hypothetical protein
MMIRNRRQEWNMGGLLSGAIYPQTSTSFAKAQTISRILATLLAIGFWFMVVVGIVLVGAWLAMAIWPLFSPLPDGTLAWMNSPKIPIPSLSFVNKLGVMATILLRLGPAVVALDFGRRVFGRFARGEVFTTGTYADIRAASLWMMVAALTSSIDQLVFNVSVGLGAHGLSFNPELLFFGLCIYVAAFVMAEARRIAEDNASIV